MAKQKKNGDTEGGGANVIIKGGVADKMKEAEKRIKKWLKKSPQGAALIREQKCLKNLDRALVAFLEHTKDI